MTGTRRRVVTVLFDGFELLDVCGPLETFGTADQRFELPIVGPAAGPVRSAQGPSLLADHAYQDAPYPDIVLVPGGIGTRRLVDDASFLRWLSDWAALAPVIASVCTGSGLLAAAGLLDGYRATSNKRTFAWATAQGSDVQWVPEARWVEDRNRWTSSGVAAGIDMALALVAHLHGEDLAAAVADGVEHDWRMDPTWDPFAAKNGLVADPSAEGGRRAH
jgi:transcriptional regulator GlxA family with amidase domain